MEEKGVPATGTGKTGNAVYPRVKGINNDTRLSLLSFNSRHSLAVHRIVTSHPEGVMVSEIQDLAGFPRGNPDNMVHRREISRCCEVLTFFRYFKKQGYKYYPTGKKPIIEDEPREFGKSDGLPRVRIQTLASMPFYARGD